MSEPSFSVRTYEESPRLNTGDNADDDARVLDAVIQEVDTPPEPKDMPVVNQEHVVKRPAVTNRLLTGTLVVPIGGFQQPVQILPLDARRKSIEVRLITTVATDVLRMSDDGNKLSNQVGAFLVQAVLPWKPDSYTGPVFIWGADLTAIGTVTWWAVTE